MDLTRHTVALDEHGECFEVEIKGVEAHIKHELTAVFPERHLGVIRLTQSHLSRGT
jgi:hypothetical protein